MFFGRNFPYSNLHDLNLDWIISEISSLKEADAEALAAILEQGVSGDSFKWRAQENTLIVTDNYDAELYRVIWDDNGFTMTRGGGTPVTYRVANGTLTAPTINATALRAGSANVTGTVAAGEIHTTTPLAVQYGGTGANTASSAIDALGGVKKSGDTMTGALSIIGNDGARGIDINRNASTRGNSIRFAVDDENGRTYIYHFKADGTHYDIFRLPATTLTDTTNTTYDILTTQFGAIAVTGANNASITDNYSRRCGCMTMIACRITLPADTTGWVQVASFNPGAGGDVIIYDRAVTASGGVAPIRFGNGNIYVYMSSGLATQQILINSAMIL